LFDILKLGRYKFSVKEFSCENQQQSADEIRQQELREAVEVVSLQSSGPNSPISANQEEDD
jgi:hypothetical protein